MLRSFTTAAILVLTAAGAQAQPSDALSTRIQHAAETACIPERGPGIEPTSHYRAIYQECVHRLSSSATVRYPTQAQVAANNKLAGN